MKWRRLFSTVVVVGLTVAGCSGSGSSNETVPTVREEFSLAPIYGQWIDECLYEIQTYRSNPSAYLEEFVAVGECFSLASLLPDEGEDFPRSGLSSKEKVFAELVTLVTDTAFAYNDAVSEVSDLFVDCLEAANGRRLVCLELVMSAEEGTKREWDLSFDRAQTLEQFLPQLKEWIQ